MEGNVMGSKAKRVPQKLSLTSSIIGVILVVSSACSSDRATGTDFRPSAVITDGRAVFQGVFFGVGETGRRLDKLWEGKSVVDRIADPINRQRAQVSMDSVTRSVESQDPTFFRRFASAMQSGQPATVEQALGDGLSRLRAAAGLVDDSTVVTDRAAADVYQVVDVYQFIQVYQVVQVYEYIAVYRYATVVEAVGSAAASARLFSDKSHLARDVLVRDITVAMAAP